MFKQTLANRQNSELVSTMPVKITRFKTIVLKVMLSGVSFLVLLAIVEVVMARNQRWWKLKEEEILQKSRASRIPRQVVCEGPLLYGLNTNYPDVSSLGLSDREYAIPKPQGMYRILMLGDSVIFRSGKDENVVNNLAKKIRASTSEALEVINAGVKGYST